MHRSVLEKMTKTMGLSISALLTCLLFSASSLAEKPDWAGNGKPSDEQKSLRKPHHDSDHEDKLDKLKKEKKEKKEKITGHDDEQASKNERTKGMEKQRDMKAEQVRKEMDKGSETGKAKRAEHSKKWWQFWGEE